MIEKFDVSDGELANNKEILSRAKITIEALLEQMSIEQLWLVRHIIKDCDYTAVEEIDELLKFLDAYSRILPERDRHELVEHCERVVTHLNLMEAIRELNGMTKHFKEKYAAEVEEDD